MSCVSFWGPGQREKLVRAMSGPPVATFASPPVGPGKQRRLEQMAASPDPRVRESAALNAHVPDEVLATLTLDPEMSVRCAVARSPRADDGVLAALATDPVAAVRRWVAAHRSVPSDVLDALADDPDDGVRDLVAWNRRWPRPAPARPAGGE